MKKKLEIIKNLKKFWHYLWHDDSLLSYVLNFALAFVFIKYIFFPVVGFALDTDYPIVAIVSGSMEHKIVDGRVCNHMGLSDERLNFDEWWGLCGEYYVKNYNLTKEEFYEFGYRNGLNVGDVMILYGKDPSKIEIGEVLVFEPQDKVSGQVARALNLEDGESFFLSFYGPVIHRVVNKWQDEDGKWHFETKGDHNPIAISEHDRLNGQIEFSDFETDIPQEDVIGVAAVKIPWIGYAKIILSRIYGFVVGLIV